MVKITLQAENILLKKQNQKLQTLVNSLKSKIDGLKIEMFNLKKFYSSLHYALIDLKQKRLDEQQYHEIISRFDQVMTLSYKQIKRSLGISVFDTQSSAQQSELKQSSQAQENQRLIGMVAQKLKSSKIDLSKGFGSILQQLHISEPGYDKKITQQQKEDLLHQLMTGYFNHKNNTQIQKTNKLNCDKTVQQNGNLSIVDSSQFSFHSQNHNQDNTIRNHQAMPNKLTIKNNKDSEISSFIESKSLGSDQFSFNSVSNKLTEAERIFQKLNQQQLNQPSKSSFIESSDPQSFKHQELFQKKYNRQPQLINDNSKQMFNAQQLKANGNKSEDFSYKTSQKQPSKSQIQSFLLSANHLQIKQITLQKPGSTQNLQNQSQESEEDNEAQQYKQLQNRMNPHYLQQLQQYFYLQQKSQLKLNQTGQLQEQLRINQKIKYKDQISRKLNDSSEKSFKLESSKKEQSIQLQSIIEQRSTNEDELGGDLIDFVQKSRQWQIQRMFDQSKQLIMIQKMVEYFPFVQKTSDHNYVINFTLYKIKQKIGDSMHLLKVMMQLFSHFHQEFGIISMLRFKEIIMDDKQYRISQKINSKFFTLPWELSVTKLLIVNNYFYQIWTNAHGKSIYNFYSSLKQIYLTGTVLDQHLLRFFGSDACNCKKQSFTQCFLIKKYQS